MDEAALMAQYIVPDPLRPSADVARVTGSNVVVWRIIRDLKAARGNVLAVAAAYGVPREVVLAVRTYYLHHAPVIDARIQAERVTAGDTRHAA
jgi:uncharacterized protein (DUF433 family)